MVNPLTHSGTAKPRPPRGIIQHPSRWQGLSPTAQSGSVWMPRCRWAGTLVSHLGIILARRSPPQSTTLQAPPGSILKRNLPRDTGDMDNNVHATTSKSKTLATTKMSISIEMTNKWGENHRTSSAAKEDGLCAAELNKVVWKKEIPEDTHWDECPYKPQKWTRPRNLLLRCKHTSRFMCLCTYMTQLQEPKAKGLINFRATITTGGVRGTGQREARGRAGEGFLLSSNPNT